jgi:hypothetical protein
VAVVAAAAAATAVTEQTQEHQIPNGAEAEGKKAAATKQHKTATTQQRKTAKRKMPNAVSRMPSDAVRVCVQLAQPATMHNAQLAQRARVRVGAGAAGSAVSWVGVRGE